MTTEEGKLIMSGLEIQAVRKDIKNIHVGVYPPNGRIRIAVPLGTTDEKIKLVIISKYNWIRKQREKFLNQKRETPREYVTGESHYFMGQRYILNVITGPYRGSIEITGKKHMAMYVSPDAGIQGRRKVMEGFYRAGLTEELNKDMVKWEERLGVYASEIRIRKMKTKWGSTNKKDKRIWISLELAKKSCNCIEYVVVHELAHLIERNHNNKFRSIMDTAMPNWKLLRDELNDLIY